MRKSGGEERKAQIPHWESADFKPRDIFDAIRGNIIDRGEEDVALSMVHHKSCSIGEGSESSC